MPVTSSDWAQTRTARSSHHSRRWARTLQWNVRGSSCRVSRGISSSDASSSERESTCCSTAFRRLDRGELWLAGDGPLRSHIESEAKEDPRIRVLGYAGEESLPDLYRQADTLVVPSHFEPWGLVVHEGLAHGLPVIATDQVAAADDLIASGVNGYVVPAGSPEALAEAMRSVAEWTPSHWREAAAHTSETLPRYGIDRAADAFVEGCLLGLRHRRSLSAPSGAA